MGLRAPMGARVLGERPSPGERRDLEKVEIAYLIPRYRGAEGKHEGTDRRGSPSWDRSNGLFRAAFRPSPRRDKGTHRYAPKSAQETCGRPWKSPFHPHPPERNEPQSCDLALKGGSPGLSFWARDDLHRGAGVRKPSACMWYAREPPSCGRPGDRTARRWPQFGAKVPHDRSGMADTWQGEEIP